MSHALDVQSVAALMLALMDAEQQQQLPRQSRASRLSSGPPAQPRASATDDGIDGRRSSTGPQGTAHLHASATVRPVFGLTPIPTPVPVRGPKERLRFLSGRDAVMKPLAAHGTTADRTAASLR